MNSFERLNKIIRYMNCAEFQDLTNICIEHGETDPTQVVDYIIYKIPRETNPTYAYFMRHNHAVRGGNISRCLCRNDDCEHCNMYFYEIFIMPPPLMYRQSNCEVLDRENFIRALYNYVVPRIHQGPQDILETRRIRHLRYTLIARIISALNTGNMLKLPNVLVRVIIEFL